MTTSRNKQQIQPVILGPGGVRAEAALYIVDDQFLFHGVDQSGAEQIKFISPGSMREAFAKEPVDSGWLPPGVLRCGTSSRGQWMLSWHKPAMYTVHLADRKTPLRVPMPSLIWFGISHNYYIFAARENEFKPNAALYRVPLANVNHHGLICFGSEEHPDVGRNGFDLAWNVFWASRFNNDHDNGKSRTHGEAINTQLIELSRQKVTNYPLKDLISMDTSLDAAIQRLTRRDKDNED